MSRTPESPQDHGSPGRQPGDGAAPRQSGWSVMSYLFAGMAAYGGIGWLVGHWTGWSILFPVGMLVGLVLATGMIIHRYGRA